MTGFWIQGDVIGPNTLIPRDPDCDTFTRPVYMVRKTVDYDHRPSVIDTTYSDSLYGDDDILATIASAPDLARMINSVVIIDLDITMSDGTVKRSSGTGCLVSPSVVFTAANIFDLEKNQVLGQITVYLNEKDYYEQTNGIEANLAEIPPQILEFNKGRNNVTSEKGDSCRETLDFAVLRLQVPVNIEQESLLKMPEVYPGSKEIYTKGQTICAMGKPGVVTDKDARSKAFENDFYQYVVEEYADNADNIFADFIRESFFGSETVVAAFGTTHFYGQDNGQNYIICTASSLNGMSGGPVVNMNAPDTLLGIAVSGMERVPKSMFLRADCPMVQVCYRHFVKDH